MRFLDHTRAALFASVLLAVSATRADAASKTTNPNHQDPMLAMAVHGEGTSEKLQDEARSRYASAAKALTTALQRESKRQINKIEPKAVGDAYAATRQLRRAALQLQLLGEPAGVDFVFRADSMNGHLGRIAQVYAGTPEGAAFLAKARAYLAKTQPERANALQRVVELARKEQWKEAETTLDATLDKLHSMTVFLTPDEQKQIHEPFYEIASKLTVATNAVRIKESDAILNGRRKSLTPALDDLLKRCGDVARGLAKSGTIELDGQMVDGPRALSALLAQWQQVHAQVQKYHGLTLAIQGRASGGGYSGMMPAGAGAGADVDPLVQRYVGDFANQIVGALAKVIEADAARAAEGEVPALYPAYLQATALTTMRYGDPSLANAFQDALRKLLAKSPAFAENVAAYDESTSELLRWRRRVAESQSRAKLAAYPFVEKTFRPAFTSKELYLGLFDQNMPEYSEPRLLAAAPDILLTALDQVIGRKVSVTDVRGIGAGKNAVSALTARTYGTLRGVSASVEPAITALKADLFVADDAGPLTLTAAEAVTSAEVGDWDLCGGTLNGLHLEAFITRLATLPDAAWPLVPLGTVPPAPRRMDAANFNLLPQAVVRFDLGPEWVQHRYFVSEIASDTSSLSLVPAVAAGRVPESREHNSRLGRNVSR